MRKASRPMTLDDVRSLITVPDEEMLPLPELFLHKSRLHGQAHIGRVVIHALRLVGATGSADQARPLWAAAYLHDLARTHDGREPGHGAAAWRRLEALPDVRDLFARAGVCDADLPAIESAVTLHSRAEASEGSPFERLTNLLKDADGLDRVRLHDLNPDYLRNPEARTMVDFATRLYDETDGHCPLSADHFARLWTETRRILLAAPARH